VNSYIDLVLNNRGGKIRYLSDYDKKEKKKFAVGDITMNKMKDIWSKRTMKDLKAMLAFILCLLWGLRIGEAAAL
jgi:integrase